MNQQKNILSKQISLLFIVIVLGGLIAYFVSIKKETNNDLEKIQNGTRTTVFTNKALSYKNGLYRATGSYDSPAGLDVISVSLTLENGIVTDAVVTPQAVVQGSKRWFEKFNTGVKQEVVGKKISELNLTQISGASLTSQGFNDALEKIKAQAKI